MKKLTLIASMSSLMLVSGCTSMHMYDGGNYNPNNYFQNTTVSTILVPVGAAANYQAPKKYCIIPEDIRAYEIIKNRAQQRQQQVQTQESYSSSSGTVPTTTNPTINKSVNYDTLMGGNPTITVPTTTTITPTPSMTIPSSPLPKVIIPPTPLPSSTTTNNLNSTQY